MFVNKSVSLSILFMQEGNKIILQKLDEFIRKYYKNQLVKGLLYSVGLLLLFYISISTLEYFAEFNSAIRAVLFYGFVFTSLFVLGKYIVVPLLKLNSFGDVISYEQAAYIVGNHFDNVQDKLLNVLQLQSEKSNYASVELLNASINQKIGELKPVPFTAAIDLNENRKYLKFVAIPFLLLFAIVVVNKKILGTGTKRLVHYNTYFEKEAPFQFEIENKSLQAMQQQDYELHVKLKGMEVPAEVFTVIGGNEYKLEKQKDEYVYVFKNVQKNVDFQLSGGGFNSKFYTLTVLPKPILVGFEAGLKYPAYLHRKDEVVSNTGDLVIPQGTKVVWTFNTKNSDGISLHFADSSLNLKPTTENKFSFSRRFMQSSLYSVNTYNKFVSKSDSVNYTVNVIPDAYPVIEMHEKADSLKKDAIYFSGNIKDDYGFNRFEFKYKIYNAESENKEQSYSMPLQANQTAQPFVHYVDISKMNLQPGDKVEYYFEVWDNDGVNGSKSAKTTVAVFKAPSLEELEKQNEQNNNQLEKDLEESLKKSKELQKEIADLNKKVLEKKQLGYDEKKQLEKLLKNQKELEKKIDELKQNNEQNNQEQNKYQQPNENVLDKQQQIEKLFNEIMTPEMKKMFEELQKLMDKMDKTQVQEQLEKLKMSDKDIEKELDRTLEQFKQMQVQEKLESTAQKLEELAKKQEQLSKEADNKKNNSEKNSEKNNDKNPEQKNQENKNNENKNSDNKNQAAENKDDKNKSSLEKQSEMNKQFDDIKKEIDKMQELNQSLENKLPLPDTKQEEQNVSQQQQNASEQLQKNNQKGASKSQQNAAQQMQQMSEQMQKAAEQMEQEEEGEDMEAIRQIMENLLHVSFSLEELNSNIKKTKANDPRYTNLAQTQKQLIDDSQIIEDSLFALSKRNPKVSANINREISAIKMNMQKSISALEERNNGEAQVRTRNAMTSVNNLALMLNESLEKMQMQMRMQPKQGSSGSCKKPGKGQKPSSSMSMGNMRKMQEQLNKQIEQMKKMLEQGQKQGGQKPGDKQGQQNNKGNNPYGNMPGMSESLAKMAAEQEALRRGMQEALQKMKKESGSQPGGDILNKMEETETDLVNKRITQETLKRQQEIMTKLLESEKAEREQEQDEKRKSNEAKTQDYGNPAMFLEYQKLKEKETELLKTIPPDMTPYYRKKVDEYFNEVEK